MFPNPSGFNTFYFNILRILMTIETFVCVSSGYQHLVSATILVPYNSGYKT
jgi:hypothetical protein